MSGKMLTEFSQWFVKSLCSSEWKSESTNDRSYNTVCNTFEVELGNASFFIRISYNTRPDAARFLPEVSFVPVISIIDGPHRLIMRDSSYGAGQAASFVLTHYMQYLFSYDRETYLRYFSNVDDNFEDFYKNTRSLAGHLQRAVRSATLSWVTDNDPEIGDVFGQQFGSEYTVKYKTQIKKKMFYLLENNFSKKSEIINSLGNHVKQSDSAYNQVLEGYDKSLTMFTSTNMSESLSFKQSRGVDPGIKRVLKSIVSDSCQKYGFEKGNTYASRDKDAIRRSLSYSFHKKLNTGNVNTHAAMDVTLHINDASKECRITCIIYDPGRRDRKSNDLVLATYTSDGPGGLLSDPEKRAEVYRSIRSTAPAIIDGYLSQQR